MATSWQCQLSNNLANKFALRRLILNGVEITYHNENKLGKGCKDSLINPNFLPYLEN